MGQAAQRGLDPRAGLDPQHRRLRHRRRPRRRSMPASLRTRSRLIRRGSASSTSNSMPAGCAMTSPRFGTRPARLETSPPSVSTSSWSPSGRSRAPSMLLEHLDRGARVGDQAAVGALDEARAVGHIMLVLDLADDLLDHILDRDQPVDAAELVDHHRDMGARLAHLHEQVEDRHRRRDEQHLAQHRRRLRLAALGDRAEHILDMDEADHVIERLAIDRNARMTLLDHAFDDLGKRRLDIERDDIDARHHHIGGRLVMHFEDIADQHPLVAAQRVGRRRRPAPRSSRRWFRAGSRRCAGGGSGEERCAAAQRTDRARVGRYCRAARRSLMAAELRRSIDDMVSR